MIRLFILIYGIASYLIGVLGLAAIVLALATIIPWGFLGQQNIASVNAVIVNAAIVFIWGLIHSVMARPVFKRAITKLIPEPAERATYVLIAGLTSVALVGYWQNIDGVVWHIQSPVLVIALWSLFCFSWVFLLGATFAINHFDLFGLRQVFLYYKQQPRPPINFVKRAMYAYIRHPIQTGVLIGVWATPRMTVTQLILSIGFTVYIFIGLWFEERDLLAEHGDTYLQYKQETGKLLPKLFR